jgi:hypothetical protein
LGTPQYVHAETVSRPAFCTKRCASESAARAWRNRVSCRCVMAKVSRVAEGNKDANGHSKA